MVEDYEKFKERLSHEDRDLIEMYFYSRKKQKEIAAFFGVTQGAISQRLNRAHQRLKNLRDTSNGNKVSE